ncbi:MAG TPA: MBL fold metallo-hydrolase [Pseudothermotoga sp.]|nr:MBL fold metallo-hydrolase [Pseudothermotoga sp.]HOK82789.1 MBL fold metallo-hydrolase [Pseudothermotoga sp.]HPP70038.1 MBL fold metallo-hydrolase [Pseudothermotoga sp.]
MIQKINERVFVIGSEGSANVVVAVQPKGVIIVDTSLFSEKAQKIRDFVENVLKREIQFLVNTHYHPDHTFGNIVFENKSIISSSLTREKIMLMDEHYLENLPASGKLVPATATFEDEYREGQVFIKRMGGHTPDSSIVLLEQERVLIAGDLVFNDFHAEIVSDSDLDAWLSALESLRKYRVDWVVPGHGNFADKGCLDSMIRYLKKIQRLVDGTITYAEILSDENFSKRGFPELFSWGLENLVAQRAK